VIKVFRIQNSEVRRKAETTFQVLTFNTGEILPGIEC
jgi:hypothetical protein